MKKPYERQVEDSLEEVRRSIRHEDSDFLICEEARALYEKLGGAVADPNSPGVKFKRVNMDQDGNCAYNSISYAEFGDQGRAAMIREQVAETLLASRSHPHLFKILAFERVDMGLSQYVEGVRNATDFGTINLQKAGLVEITAYCVRYGRFVEVYRQGSSDGVYHLLYTVGDKGNKVTRLAYNGNHFDVLVPSQERENTWTLVGTRGAVRNRSQSSLGSLTLDKLSK